MPPYILAMSPLVHKIFYLRQQYGNSDLAFHNLTRLQAYALTMYSYYYER
jgi:hypothetical protein